MFFSQQEHQETDDDGDFVRLWCGSAVSLLGTQVSGVALPLTAVLVLGATPWEMGLLNAARWLPWKYVVGKAGERRCVQRD